MKTFNQVAIRVRARGEGGLRERDKVAVSEFVRLTTMFHRGYVSRLPDRWCPYCNGLVTAGSYGHDYTTVLFLCRFCGMSWRLDVEATGNQSEFSVVRFVPLGRYKR